MTHTRKMKQLLERMAQIERMERGKLCQMTGRPHYNHQTWEEGRNTVRYVSIKETGFLQEAIDGYSQFMKLAEQYVDEVIKQTRNERDKLFAKPENVTKRGQRKTVKKN